MNRRTEIENASREHNEKNDCAVRATAVVTGLDYSVVHEAYRRAGRKSRRGTPTLMTLAVLKSLGFNAREIQVKAKTMRTLHSTRELPVWGSFLVRSTRHMTGVTDRAFLDWATTTCKRVRQVWEITKL